MGEFVNVQVTDGVGTIRLDRPPMNAISVQMQAELRAAAATVSATPAIRAAVVYGGEKTFAAGADVKEMADKVYTGRFVDADEALRIGLVDQVVPDGDVYDAATRLAAQFCAGPAQALRAAKQAIDAGLGVDLDTGLGIERLHFSALFATEDQKIGMHSFVENGPGKARFVGR